MDADLLESPAAAKSLVVGPLASPTLDSMLEVIWFYSAVGFHEAVSGKKDALDRLAAIRDLLQLLSACSASCGGAKSVALLVPAVAELYLCAIEEKKLSGKEAKKVRKEIESLVEGIVSFISICSGRSSNGGEFADGCLLPCSNGVEFLKGVKRYYGRFKFKGISVIKYGT